MMQANIDSERLSADARPLPAHTVILLAFSLQGELARNLAGFFYNPVPWMFTREGSETAWFRFVVRVPVAQLTAVGVKPLELRTAGAADLVDLVRRPGVEIRMARQRGAFEPPEIVAPVLAGPSALDAANSAGVQAARRYLRGLRDSRVSLVDGAPLRRIEAQTRSELYPEERTAQVVP